MADVPSELRYEATEGFMRLLDVTGCSLAVSVYLQGRVLLVSAIGNDLKIYSCHFERPMGLATTIDGGELRMAIAAFQDVVVLADAPLLAKSLPGHSGEFDHLLVPRAQMFTGDIDAHDLAWIGHRLYAVNTRFSCIAEIDGRYSFTPVWHPPFVTELMPEDRCHLNGLAAVENRIAYATAFSQYDTPRGWSENRLSGGVLMEVPSGKVVLDGLCMPHSPRVFDNQLYVLDSGTGRVLRVDAESGTSRPLAQLPGFARGFDRLGDILFVGLSRIRERAGIRLPIQDTQETLMCGIAAVERKNGQVLGWLRFDAAYEEIFDVKVLPKFRRGGMLSNNDDGHRQALVLPGRAFWAVKV